MTKKLRLLRIDQYEDDFLKYVVLGDKETNGASLSTAIITIKQTPDELAQEHPTSVL